MKKHIFLLPLFLLFLSVASAEESFKDLLKAAEKKEKDNITVFKKVSESFIFIGGGSGVCISEDGYMLTNQHVVAEHDVWTVQDMTGKSYKAQVIGRDTYGDLCLLKLENAKGMKFSPLASNNTVVIGQDAIAVGDPFKLGMRDFIPSISSGIISGEHLFMDGMYSYTYSDAVQTDAAVNPGNSGGPLFNRNGEIVGINGQIRSNGIRANRGIGLAISADRIRHFLPALKAAKGGIVMHGFITGITIPQDDKPHPEGMRITNILKDSLAHRKGLRKDDIISKIDGHEIKSLTHYQNHLIAKLPNTVVTLHIKRGQKEIILKYKLDSMAVPPKHFGPTTTPKSFTSRRSNDDPFEMRTGFTFKKDSFVIANIEEGSPAHASGLIKGDTIISVNDNTDIKAALKAVKYWKVQDLMANKIIFVNVVVKRKIKGMDLTYEYKTTLKLDFLY